LLSDIQRIGPQGVLHAALAVIDPLLDLRRRRIVGSAGLGNRRFTLNNLQHQGALALGGPTLDVVFLFVLIVNFLNYDGSRFSLGQYTHIVPNNLTVTGVRKSLPSVCPGGSCSPYGGPYWGRSILQHVLSQYLSQVAVS
jgi:hypothetical protein